MSLVAGRLPIASTMKAPPTSMISPVTPRWCNSMPSSRRYCSICARSIFVSLLSPSSHDSPILWPICLHDVVTQPHHRLLSIQEEAYGYAEAGKQRAGERRRVVERCRALRRPDFDAARLVVYEPDLLDTGIQVGLRFGSHLSGRLLRGGDFYGQQRHVMRHRPGRTCN